MPLSRLLRHRCRLRRRRRLEDHNRVGEQVGVGDQDLAVGELEGRVADIDVDVLRVESCEARGFHNRLRNLPVFDRQSGNAAEFGRVVCDKRQLICQSNRGNHGVVRADHLSAIG
jgi:hypothetical protein